jgi:hypothetical protein
VCAEWSGLDEEAKEESYYGDSSYYYGGDRGMSYDKFGAPGLQPKLPPTTSKPTVPLKRSSAEALARLRTQPLPFLLNDDFSVANGLKPLVDQLASRSGISAAAAAEAKSVEKPADADGETYGGIGSRWRHSGRPGLPSHALRLRLMMSAYRKVRP